MNVQRNGADKYQCRCLLDDERCIYQAGPDHPFCSECEDRHEGYNIGTVGAVPLTER